MIDLCFSVFPWAPFRSAKAAVKMHTLLDQLLPEAGCLLYHGSWPYRFRASISLSRSRQFHCHSRQFESQGTAALFEDGGSQHGFDLRSNRSLPRLLCTQGLRSTVATNSVQRSGEQQGAGFLTNNFALPALTITELYRCRWQIEEFFKWIKQHLRIKAFFGTSENAVKTQTWTAVSVYLHVAIVKKSLKLSASLYELLQILSLTLFERTPMDQLLTKSVTDEIQTTSENQLFLFE